jgi:hypothetical protein
VQGLRPSFERLKPRPTDASVKKAHRIDETQKAGIGAWCRGSSGCTCGSLALSIK